MTDLSTLSDDQLKAMYNSAPKSLSAMSDEELKAAYAVHAAPQPSSGIGDFFKSIPRGALSGFSTAASALGRATQAEMGQFEETAPTPAQGLATMEKNVTGPLHQPEGRAGKYGAAIGETLGNPASYVGPGGMLLKTAAGITSAVGGEAAGQATEGTSAEPYARTLGAIAGGIIPRAPKAPPKVVAPTVAELKAASRAGYNSPEVAAVEVHPQPVADLSTKIENDLASKGFRDRPNQGKPVFEEIRDLVPPTQTLSPDLKINSVKVADLHSARKALGEIAKEVDAVGKPTSNAAAATIAKNHLDEFLPNIQQRDVLAGDAGRASAIMKEADANWHAAKKAEQVDLQLTRADRQAAKSGMGGNIENSMRQKISSILDNPKRTVGFTGPEKQAMEDIVRGTKGRNALRAAGKLGVDGGLSLMLNMGAAIGSGGTTIPITAAGTIARILGQRSTARAGERLSEMIRSNSPVGAGNVGSAAVSSALSRQPSKARARLPYSAIVSALMQPQTQRVR